MFWNKKNDTSSKPLNSVEYEQLSKRITELDTRISAFKSALADLETNVSSLRGKFNARIKGLTEEDKKVEEKPKEKPLISNEYIAFG